jgi:hypothetical protein
MLARSLVVGVPFGIERIKCRIVAGVQRRSFLDAFGQIRIGNKMAPCEANRSFALVNGFPFAASTRQVCHEHRLNTIKRRPDVQNEN